MDDKNFKRIITLKKRGIKSIKANLKAQNLNNERMFNIELSNELKKRLTLNYFKRVYENYQKRFYKHLEPFKASIDGWDKYKLDNHENKTNKNYLPEVMLSRFFTDVSINYLEKYPFMKKYSPLYPEYKDFLKSLNHYETFDIESKRGGISVKVELFNVKESDISFPKGFETLTSVHSALHSIATVLKSREGDLKDFSNILIHEHPLTTHIGDTEYVKYMANELNLPLIVLTRNENLSFILQQNGVPKQGHIGRYCTRVYKVEPARILYKHFFYPFVEKIRYDMKKSEIIGFAKKNNIDIPKSLKKREEVADFVVKRVEEKKLIPENATYSKRFKISNQSLEPDNIVQFMGIAAYQSKRRSQMNPNLKLTHYSNAKKGFQIYELLPIFNDTFEQVKSIFDKSGLVENPYDNEYRNLNSFYIAGTKEIRFGCILCPYKDIHYYNYLKENYPDRYYYDHLIRTIASAKNIIRDDREYFYFDERSTPKKHSQLIKIM